MEIEHKTEVFTIDDKLPGKISDMVRDGWELAPGTPPVAVYHLVRVKKGTAHGMGDLIIRDELITVIPADKNKPN